MATFKELLRASFKSEDTEEWLDVHFTRPIGLAFALLWIRLGIHPNAITVLSIFLGLGAGWMFYYPDWQHNLCGVALLMFANFCDSTDGQMARLTGQKTLVGRMLDGFSGDVWFAAIYIAIALRLMNDTVPGTDVRWGIWIWALVPVYAVTLRKARWLIIIVRYIFTSCVARIMQNWTTHHSSAPYMRTIRHRKIGWGNSSSIITLATVSRRNTVRRLFSPSSHCGVTVS